MVDAWLDAIEHQYHGDNITAEMIARWGMLIEPTVNDPSSWVVNDVNQQGYREVSISIGNPVRGYTPIGVDPEVIPERMQMLVDSLDDMEALEGYRAFEGIHPFLDGNGRTGKIILNWMNGTMINPIFPPEDFWGERIDNP
jgi:hypothetical protein